MQINNVSSIQIQLAEILCKIPQDVWQLIVKKDPEWHELEPLRTKFLNGSFSVFMLAVGLNAYQLKGRAELNYWPQLYECLKDHDSIPSIEIFYEYLAEFYKKERLNAAKIERLARFLKSPNAEQLWTKSPKEIAPSIYQIWHSLGNVMSQKLHEKTICFAMKCLGVSLMMANEFSFDFQNIPIPVDSRINKFTNSLGFDFAGKTRTIQCFWRDVLASVQLFLPQINMIHLDSLIWQIAHHDTDELVSYFEDLGIRVVGRCIASILGGNI
jgi:DNA-(apurinic or apyrimidinic site) lyase